VFLSTVGTQERNACQIHAAARHILSASCELERKGERDGAAFIFITTQLLRRPFSPEKELKRKHCAAWAKFIHFASNGSLVLSSLPLSLPVCVRLAGCASPLPLRAMALLRHTQIPKSSNTNANRCQHLTAEAQVHTATKTTTITKLGTTYKKRREEEEEEEKGTLSVCLVAPLLPFPLV